MGKVVKPMNCYNILQLNRIPDPAHVLSARGWARGEERKQIITVFSSSLISYLSQWEPA
jgi:hypothetical protein